MQAKSYQDFGFGVHSPDDKLHLMPFHRRSVQDYDVKMDILFCGICHTDIHMAHDGWGISKFPCVPGHEFVGRISEIGSKVSLHKVGDVVGVGFMCHSCMECNECRQGLEQYCSDPTKNIFTFGGDELWIGGHTFGGYSTTYVIHEHFAIPVPPNLDLSRVAPLFCAGVTVFNSLKTLNVKPGMNVGLVGFGGLGHLAVQMAHKMGAKVTVFTRFESKSDDIMAVGGHAVVISTDEKSMEKAKETMDCFIDIASGEHEISKFLKTLKMDGTYCFTSMPETSIPLWVHDIQLRRRKIIGTYIGSIQDQKDMLKFCAEHQVLPLVEMTSIENVNECWDRVVKGDVKYRFVIDIKDRSQCLRRGSEGHFKIEPASLDLDGDNQLN